jgi:hypothetical protein
MGMYCIQTKRGSKRLREPPIHLSQNMIGCGMLSKLIRFLKKIYYGLRMAYYDTVLLLLIISATWIHLQAWLSILV